MGKKYQQKNNSVTKNGHTRRIYYPDKGRCVNAFINYRVVYSLLVEVFAWGKKQLIISSRCIRKG